MSLVGTIIYKKRERMTPFNLGSRVTDYPRLEHTKAA